MRQIEHAVRPEFQTVLAEIERLQTDEGDGAELLQLIVAEVEPAQLRPAHVLIHGLCHGQPITAQLQTFQTVQTTDSFRQPFQGIAVESQGGQLRERRAKEVEAIN
ncbi:hypothetical protein D3C81_1146760 [compost metagenome]